MTAQLTENVRINLSDHVGGDRHRRLSSAPQALSLRLSL